MSSTAHWGVSAEIAWCVALALTGMAACGSRGASYPDGPKVVEAQKKWCASLGEIVAGEGKGASWDKLAQCERAFPGGSPEFVAGMAGCIGKQARISGAAAFDAQRAVDDCTEQVLQQLDVRGAAKLDVVKARCARMERCQKVTGKDCLTGFEGLSPPEQARLTRMYNEGALHDAASRLESLGCAKDEDSAMVSCYADGWKSRVWLPEGD
jgi:hypothetical protein